MVCSEKEFNQIKIELIKIQILKVKSTPSPQLKNPDYIRK